MIEKTLEDLGFTKGEIKVYLTLLNIGETTTGKIIEKAKISGGKVYQILDKLEDKGLVSHIVKNKTKYFSASSPKRIFDYLNEEKEKLVQTEKEVQKEMPFLTSIQDMHKKRHETTLFLGAEGIKTAIFQALDELNQDDEALAMGVRGDKGEFFNIMWEKWHKERASRKIKGRFIFSQRDKKVDKIFKNIKQTEIRYLESITPSAIGILKESVLIQTYEDEPSCLLIKNEQISKSFRSFFENLWKLAKK